MGQKSQTHTWFFWVGPWLVLGNHFHLSESRKTGLVMWPKVEELEEERKWTWFGWGPLVPDPLIVSVCILHWKWKGNEEGCGSDWQGEKLRWSIGMDWGEDGEVWFYNHRPGFGGSTSSEDLAWKPRFDACAIAYHVCWPSHRFFKEEQSTLFPTCVTLTLL